MTQLIDQPCWWRTRETDWQIGKFRRFGVGSLETRSGIAQVTTAIVETHECLLIMVDLYCVSFADQKPPTPVDVTPPDPQPELTSDDAAMATFGRKALDALKASITEVDNCIDVDDLAESAEQLGLMRRVEFDPDKHNKLFLSHDYRRGDMVYVWGTDDAK